MFTNIAIILASTYLTAYAIKKSLVNPQQILDLPKEVVNKTKEYFNSQNKKEIKPSKRENK